MIFLGHILLFVERRAYIRLFVCYHVSDADNPVPEKEKDAEYDQMFSEINAAVASTSSVSS